MNMLKKRTSLFFFLIIGLLVLVVIIQWIKSNNIALISKMTTENNNFFSTSNHPSIPDSNMEWFLIKSRMKQGFLKNFITTYTVYGTVVDISNRSGFIQGLKTYYTEKKGHYYYRGAITIKNNNSENLTAHFSDKRMNSLKVYKITEKGLIEKKLTDIKKGDFIEIEEAVDLALSNINDENLLYLTIRILKSSSN